MMSSRTRRKRSRLTEETRDLIARGAGVLLGLFAGLQLFGVLGSWYKASTPNDLWVQMYNNTAFGIIAMLSAVGAAALGVALLYPLTTLAWSAIKRRRARQ